MTNGFGESPRTATDVFRPNLSEAEYIDALDAEGRILLTIAETRRSDAHIPFCPVWTLSDLVLHLGFIYRWTSTVVGDARMEPPGPLERSALQDPDPLDYPGALDRLRSAHADLVHLLRQSPPSLRCWTIWPSVSPRFFWMRRMLHETLIHRVDAHNAGIITSTMNGDELPTALAADGVDEMVCGFARRYANTLRSERPGILALYATDADHRWWIEIGQQAPQFGRGAPSSPADTEVHALSGGLLLLLWNRRLASGLAVKGRVDVLDTWAREAHL